MFYSKNGKKAFADLNYFNYPYHVQHPHSFNAAQSIYIRSNENEQYLSYPRKVKLVVIHQEEELKSDENFTISGSFQIGGVNENCDKSISETQTTTSSDIITESEQLDQQSKPKFYVSKSYYTDENLTEFNNHPKLKKINSSYHLKRKISTKLQNEIKNSINKLIVLVNSELDTQLPLMSPMSKEFRENVKIEFVKFYGNQTISKFASEDVMMVRKKATDLSMNKKLISEVQKLHDNNLKSPNLKKLFNLLYETLIKDFYNEFLISSRFKVSMENDVKRYKDKLDNLLHLPESKKKMFRDIFIQKYDGVAKKFF